MPFRISFSMTWRSCHHIILFFSYGKKSNLNTKSLCCLFYLVTSFFNQSKNNAVLEPRTGNFRGPVGPDLELRGQG